MGRCDVLDAMGKTHRNNEQIEVCVLGSLLQPITVHAWWQQRVCHRSACTVASQCWSLVQLACLTYAYQRLPHICIPTDICPLVATRRSSAAAGCGSRSGRRCSRRWVARTVNAQRQALTHRIKLPWHPLISRSAQPTCSAQPGGQHPQAVQRRRQRAQQAGQHNGDLPRLHNVEAPSDAEPVPRALHPPAPQGWGRQEA